MKMCKCITSKPLPYMVIRCTFIEKLPNIAGRYTQAIYVYRESTHRSLSIVVII